MFIYSLLFVVEGVAEQAYGKLILTVCRSIVALVDVKIPHIIADTVSTSFRTILIVGGCGLGNVTEHHPTGTFGSRVLERITFMFVRRILLQVGDCRICKHEKKL